MSVKISLSAIADDKDLMEETSKVLLAKAIDNDSPPQRDSKSVESNPITQQLQNAMMDYYYEIDTKLKQK